MHEPTSIRKAIDEAIGLLRANGYRVTKPKPKRRDRVGPTFVAVFADGETTRMSTFTDLHDLDWERGHALSRAAYESRARRKDRKWSGLPPAIVRCHFEQDGVVLARAGERDMHG
jgi:hypothetical protein